MSFLRYVAAASLLGALATGCGGGGADSITVSPASLSFGDVEVGTSETAMLTVTNEGKSALQLVAASVTGADADLFSHGLTLPIYLVDGGEVELAFAFAPEELGAASASLTLAYDDGGGTTVSMTGTGVGPSTPTEPPTPEPTPTEPPTPLPGDLDGDGYNPSRGDCNEGDASINPGALEICGDSIDQDCSGVADDGPDADEDGIIGCGPNADCDDGDPLIYPGATEQCNGEDDDCDGANDETFDADGDGVGTCGDTPDCDDTNPNTAPGLLDLCLPGDNDCDGAIDEDAGDVDGNGVPDCEDSCPLYVDASDTPVGSTDGSAGNPFPSIAAGVQNHGECTTLYVLPGTYLESVTIPEGVLTIEAVQGPELTQIVGTGGPAFKLVGAHTVDTVISGFGLTGSGQDHGSCVRIEGGSPTIKENVFEGCTASLSGAAVYSEGGAPTITDNDFLSNVSAFGGAIYATGTGTIINRNLFQGNSASEGDGGAVTLVDDAGAMVAGNLFIENTAARNGGALVALTVQGLLLDTNDFTDNTAGGDGGAVVMGEVSSLTMTRNTFSGGTSEGETGGGGVLLDTVTDATLTDETYTGNAAANGGGLLVRESSEVSMSGLSFTSNTATGGGGGAFLSASTADLADSTLTGGSALNGGGVAAQGAGVYNLSGLTVYNNTSTAGPASVAGGAGVYFGLGAQGEVRQSLIYNNHAEVNGGGLYVIDSSPTIRNCVIAGNTATLAGPFTGQGGGIYVSIGSPVIKNNTFVGNSAPGNGGGIVWSAGSDGIRFDANIIAASEDGAGAYAYDDTASFTYNDLYDNLDGGEPVNYAGYTAFPTKLWTDQTGKNGNISEDALFVAFSDDGDWTNDDFHLQAGSPCADTGPNTPDFNDSDGSRNDIGAYGGPLGDW